MNQPMQQPTTYITTSRASYDIGYVGPNNTSEFKLSSGMYSLSSRSNVPYISLEGAAGFRKVASWGEVFEVPPNQSCAIKNESFHGGDIFINSGCDYDNRPAAITIPCTPELVDGDQYWYTPMPVDVRMARRAYFTFDGNVDTIDGAEVLVYIVGFRDDGSHQTMTEINAPGGGFVPTSPAGVGYMNVCVMTAGEWFGHIPLGQGCVLGEDRGPHSLLTTARVFLSPASGFRPAWGPPNIYNAYWTVEY